MEFYEKLVSRRRLNVVLAPILSARRTKAKDWLHGVDGDAEMELSGGHEGFEDEGEEEDDDGEGDVGPSGGRV
jgi:hypothetical protein